MPGYPGTFSSVAYGIILSSNRGKYIARLPQPGADHGAWGDILNEYLQQSHASDGLLKPDSVGATQLKQSAVTANAIAPNSITNSAIASNAINATSIADGSITNSLIADDTIQEAKLHSSVRSKLNQGSAVTSVASKTGDVTLVKSDVGLDNVDNTSDADKPIGTATQTALDGKQPLSARLSAIDSATITSGSAYKILYTNSAGASWASLSTFSFGRSLMGTGDAAAAAALLTSNVTLAGTETLTNKTITSPRANQILDTNGAIIASLDGTASAVNYWSIRNQATGGRLNLAAAGSDTNISIGLSPKGTGDVQIYQASGTTVRLAANGADTNVGMNIATKGTGVVQANGVDLVTITGTQTLTNKTLTQPRIDYIRDINGATILTLSATASAVNYLSIGNRAAGTSPAVSAVGADTNIDVGVVPKGAGSFTVYVGSGQTPTVRANGQDADHSLNLLPKGTGKVLINGVPAVAQVTTPPVSAVATGIAGQIAYDANYFYQCVATNTWKRSPLSSW